MKTIAILTAGLMTVAGGAFAGGYTYGGTEPVAMAPAAPIGAPLPTRDWTGGYAGLSLGHGGAEAENDGDETDGNGTLGGAFLGYQYDFGGPVLGGEIDLNTAEIVLDGLDGDIDQIHRFKARAGYGLGDVLVYGTAGAAYAEFGDASDVGYVAGAGLDYQIAPQVTVGGEVLYHGFDDFDNTGIDANATTVQGRVGFQF